MDDRRVRLHREAEPVAAAADDEKRGEDHDRKQEVRARPGEDHEHFLPGPLAPVSVAAEPVLELVEPALGRLPGAVTDLEFLERLLELGQERSRGLHVALFEPALDPLDRSEELRRFRQCRPEERLQIRRGRPVHPRNLHVAAEWDGTDSVLDSFALHLDDRRGKADVETTRAHAHGTCG